MIQAIHPLLDGAADIAVPAPHAPRPALKNPILLHCGGRVVGRQELFEVPTPRETSTWFPLAHRTLVEEVENQLGEAGFDLLQSTHALSHEGHRYFGILEIASHGVPQDPDKPHGWVVGLRNSHDKSFPAGLVAGTRVFVCDNLAFSGLIQIRRKHTRFAARDLRQLTARAVGQLGDRLLQIDQRIDAYRALKLRDRDAHDLVIRASDCRAIVPSQIPDVVRHWRKPEHQEFRPRTGWSLFNAFTEVLKQSNPQTVIARSEALHGLFDGAAGVALEA